MYTSARTEQHMYMLICLRLPAAFLADITTARKHAGAVVNICPKDLARRAGQIVRYNRIKARVAVIFISP